ncbi:hypothetical protein TPA0598_04_03190 [Streptomyces lydicamycinicus]|uniref:Minor tail protein n=1 Tax=Streptomyces lydicamycinicus TaxID=1546107 RepID=A0A0N7YLF7_9ACTN|nr:hypothetical protein [Streptomyces lydicamycinicus]GAO08683.1 hypothetical protein TPA0598_04_03190 [Streptomyces lydicamycinicus]
MAYRYITARALTGDVLAWDLPMTDVEFGPSLSAAGTFTGSVEPRLATLVREQVDAGDTWLYVERDGRLMWGGLVWRASPEGSQLQVEAAGPGSYAARRHDLHGNLGGRGPYVNEDPCNVIRDVWRYLQEQPDGDLGIVVDDTTSKVTVGTPADRYSVDWWEAPVLGDVVDDMVQVEGGPEWTETLAWSGEKPQHRIRIGWPRLGTRRTDLAFTSGVNIIKPVSVEYDADEAAQVVIGLGAGEGRNRRRAIDAVRNGRLRLEHVLEVASEKGEDRLTARARTERIARQVTGEVTEIVVRDHPTAPIGAWQIGDDVRVRVHDEWADYDMWSRIVSYQIHPGSGESEQAVIQLRRADRFTYGGGA